MKRGISPVVATVLLLLITIVAVSMIAVFIVPFIKGSLEKSGECFEVLEGIGFDNTGYNCFVEGEIEGELDMTGFSVKIDSDEIAGFKIALKEGGTSEAYSIFLDTENDDLAMLGGVFGDLLELPGKGGVRTYVALGIFDTLEINPLLKSGKPCKTTDTRIVKQCNDPDVVADIESTTLPDPGGS